MSAQGLDEGAFANPRRTGDGNAHGLPRVRKAFFYDFLRQLLVRGKGAFNEGNGLTQNNPVTSQYASDEKSGRRRWPGNLFGGGSIFNGFAQKTLDLKV